MERKSIDMENSCSSNEETKENCCTPIKKKLCTCGTINKKLLVCKGFYFFFWSAVGSFFPLLGVYFKQLGMTPTQSGLLVGCRPLIEFISAPSLGSLADRFNQRKLMLLFNLVCWICFVFPFAFIKPADNTCHRYKLLSKNISELTSQETSEVKEFLKPNTPIEPQIQPHRKSAVALSEESVHQVFLVLLFLTLVGEFFASPATTLADTATLNYLGENKEKYGRQRMFGSLGWGTAMLAVGSVIEYMPPYSVCGELMGSDYTYGFYFFIAFMICAFLVALKFSFHDADADTEVLTGTAKDVIKIFLAPTNLIVVFTAFYAGLGMGLARVFLFWHLEDLGAPPTLFGISSALDHLSETVTYFFTEIVIRYIGHIEVLCLALVANFIRFLCISYLVNPWLILPLDILQGFAHAGFWASLTSYMGRVAPKGYKAAVQGVLQGFYYGLGRAVGAIGGGMFIHAFGTNKTFRLYGIGSAPALMILYVSIKLLNRRKSLETKKNDEQVVEEGEEVEEQDTKKEGHSEKEIQEPINEEAAEPPATEMLEDKDSTSKNNDITFPLNEDDKK